MANRDQREQIHSEPGFQLGADEQRAGPENHGGVSKVLKRLSCSFGSQTQTAGKPAASREGLEVSSVQRGT